MSDYIFFTGKPDTHPDAPKAVRKLGFKTGLFWDRNLPLTDPSQYDTVVELDFTNTEHVADGLERTKLQVAGIVCTYENYLLARAGIAERLGLPAQSYESARMCTDKFLMRQAFMRRDKSITPNFALVSSKEELLTAAAELSYPLILKPTNLVKSLLILTCKNEAELVAHFEYAKNRIGELYKEQHIYGREPQLLVEEFVDGKLCSVAAFVDEHGRPHFCKGVASLVNARDIGANDNYLYARHLPADLPADLEKQIFEVAAKGIEALEMRSSPAHVELIYNEEGVKLIEIGARIGGYRPRMYRMSYGLNLIEQEVRLAIGKQPELAGELRAYSGVYELFPDKEGPFATLEGAVDPSQYAYFNVKAAPGQIVGPAKNGYKATAAVIVTAADRQTFDRLCRTVDNMKVVTS